eukprot:1016548-Ditylum_brightwellii.AAC.1
MVKSSKERFAINERQLAACYDRIIPNITNIIGWKKGLHRNLIFVHASTLAKAKYKLRTAFG